MHLNCAGKGFASLDPKNAHTRSNFRILSRSTNYCLFLNIKGTSRSENVSQREVCRKTRDYFSFKLSFNRCNGVGWAGAGWVWWGK